MLVFRVSKDSIAILCTRTAIREITSPECSYRLGQSAEKIHSKVNRAVAAFVFFLIRDSIAGCVEQTYWDQGEANPD